MEQQQQIKSKVVAIKFLRGAIDTIRMICKILTENKI